MLINLDLGLQMSLIFEQPLAKVKFGYNMILYPFDFDLNPLTFVLNLDLDMIKMHLYWIKKFLVRVIK